jgi:hypothetical protein
VGCRRYRPIDKAILYAIIASAIIGDGSTLALHMEREEQNEEQNRGF